jgi:hypothetical protein
MATEARNGLEAWKETIVQGLESGASFSQGFPRQAVYRYVGEARRE